MQCDAIAAPRAEKPRFERATTIEGQIRAQVRDFGASVKTAHAICGDCSSTSHGKTQISESETAGVGETLDNVGRQNSEAENMEQSAQAKETEPPSCLLGCGVAFVIASFCGLALSLMAYTTQALFNRVPLDNGNYNLIYLFTFPLGAIVGIIAAWILWWFKPRRRKLAFLIGCVLVFMLAVSIFLFTAITNPNDPSFTRL